MGYALKITRNLKELLVVDILNTENENKIYFQRKKFRLSILGELVNLILNRWNGMLLSNIPMLMFIRN